jgi:hypothetical protein
MKTFALITAFLTTNVLANWDDPNTPFSTNANMHQIVTMTWIPVDDIAKVCHEEGRKRLKNFASRNWGPSEACAFWTGNNCNIYTKRNPTMHELGHEVRHCFQGGWH